jgi:hypothetical protein
MKIFQVISEAETLGAPDSVSSLDDLKKSFSEDEWHNIIASLASNYMRGKSDNAKFSDIQRINRYVGTGSNKIDPHSWNSEAQMFGLNAPEGGPGLTWQAIHDHLAPHKNRKHNIKPTAGEVKTEINVTQSLQMTASWVPVPESTTLNKEQAKQYVTELFDELDNRSSEEFKDFLNRKPEGQDKNIVEKLWDSYMDKIKQDLAEDDQIETDRVHNLFSAWLDTYIDVYRDVTGNEAEFK